MKKVIILSISLCVAEICSLSAQSAKEQTATDACPSWSSKKRMNSSGVYVPETSKKAAAKQVNDFTTPRYKYLFAGKAVKNTDQKETTSTHTAQRPDRKNEEMITVADNKKVKEKNEVFSADIKEKEVPVVEKEKPATVIEKDIPAKGEGAAAQTSAKESVQKKEHKKTKEKKYWLRKLKLKRKKAADCPDF